MNPRLPNDHINISYHFQNNSDGRKHLYVRTKPSLLHLYSKFVCVYFCNSIRDGTDTVKF